MKRIPDRHSIPHQKEVYQFIRDNIPDRTEARLLMRKIGLAIQYGYGLGYEDGKAESVFTAKKEVRKIIKEALK